MVRSSKDPVATVFTQYWRVLGRDCQGLVLCRVTRRLYSERTGGKILLVRDHRDGREDQLGSLPSLIPFSLAVPPFQPKMVGSYLICGIWFHSHLLVEEISYIQILRPMVHEVQDPDRYIFR
jgi:hypothetical protein